MNCLWPLRPGVGVDRYGKSSGGLRGQLPMDYSSESES
jgi:hypothetical protein